MRTKDRDSSGTDEKVTN